MRVDLPRLEVWLIVNGDVVYKLKLFALANLSDAVVSGEIPTPFTCSKSWVPLRPMHGIPQLLGESDSDKPSVSS